MSSKWCLSPHDIDHLESYDRILWLEKGQLIADGAPADVLPAYREKMERLVFSDDEILGPGLPATNGEQG